MKLQQFLFSLIAVIAVSNIAYAADQTHSSVSTTSSPPVTATKSAQTQTTARKIETKRHDHHTYHRNIKHHPSTQHHPHHPIKKDSTVSKPNHLSALPIIPNYSSTTLKAEDVATTMQAAYAANNNEQLNHVNTVKNDEVITNPNQSNIVSFIHLTMHRLTYSCYRLGGTYFNILRGIYKVDCSDYVDNVLATTVPSAYQVLQQWSRTPKPNSSDYYQMFSRLQKGTEMPGWSDVNSVPNLEAGDILVFRYQSLFHRALGGHVMIVMDKPMKSDRFNDVYWVRVSDSAPSGHSDDTRARHVSGIGIGTLLLKINPTTGQPIAYAWNVQAPWQYHTLFTMARPLEISANQTSYSKNG